MSFLAPQERQKLTDSDYCKSNTGFSKINSFWFQLAQIFSS